MLTTALQCSCGDNGYKIWTFFKILVSKNANLNDKYVLKMSSNYDMEQKTLIEASYTNNIHT